MMRPPLPKCALCGSSNAPLGLGPPATETLLHYCGPCWSTLPRQQAQLARSVRDALEEE